jgi:hypothetical protein
MNTLQEFLKQRADHIRETLPERVRVQNEWIQAVERLITDRCAKKVTLVAT